uniref:Uncharacterized protein n=1 Tax=Bursaphelenchus xylophilus TaxID=6326 RepID=A0A1I7SG21_BURXY
MDWRRRERSWIRGSRRRLEHFKPVHVEVECESQHNVPMGVEIEFRVQIASDKFDGLSKIYVILIILIGLMFRWK